MQRVSQLVPPPLVGDEPLLALVAPKPRLGPGLARVLYGRSLGEMEANFVWRVFMVCPGRTVLVCGGIHALALCVALAKASLYEALFVVLHVRGVVGGRTRNRVFPYTRG